MSDSGVLTSFIDALKARGINPRDVTVQMDGRRAWREMVEKLGKFSNVHIFEVVPVSIKFRVKNEGDSSVGELLQHYKQTANYKVQVEGQWEGLKLLGGSMPDAEISKEELRKLCELAASSYRQITGKSGGWGSESKALNREPAGFGPMANEDMSVNLGVLLRYVGSGDRAATGQELKEAYEDALSYLDLRDRCNFETFCNLYPWFLEDKEKHPELGVFGAYFFWLEGSKKNLSPITDSDDEGDLYWKEMVISFIQKNADKASKNKEKVLDQMMKKCHIHPRAREQASELMDRLLLTSRSS